MKKVFILMILSLILFGGCVTVKNYDFTGSWQVQLKYDNGLTESRMLRLKGYENGGQVYYLSEEIGTWNVLDNRFLIDISYSTDFFMIGEMYFGEVESEDVVTGTFTIEKTNWETFSELGFTGKFRAERF